MSKLTKNTIFKASKTVAETNLDKTTRIVREITEDEAEKRQIKTARLRTARLERQASTPTKPEATRITKPGKKAPGKAKAAG